MRLPMTTRFVLVRHGEAQGNRELRYLGASDVPLTERGEQQAVQLARAVATFPLHAIYTSPLARARTTAAAIGLTTGLEPTAWDDLREQNYGSWEGLTHEEAWARDEVALAAWEADASVTPPDGEGLMQMQARVLAAADALAARHPDAMVALVSHVGPIKMLVCAALGLPPSGARRMWLDPASISVIDWHPKAAGASTGLLRIFNANTHLDPPVRWLANPEPTT
jgi:broad specificity phosphatase PhoE